MQNSTIIPATLNNEVVNSQSAAPAKTEAKTQRVFETQADWARLEAHTIVLLATLAKGEKLAENAKEPFGFGITTDKNGVDTKCPTKGKDGMTLSLKDTQPHAKNYVLCLLKGFVSSKATKFLKGTSLESVDRSALADAVVKLLYPKGNLESASKNPAVTSKRGKWIAEQVLNAVNGVAVQPTTEEAPKPKARKTTAKGGKAKKSAKVAA